MKVKILDESNVIAIHDAIIAESGGLAGLSPDKSLASALYRIQDYITYEGISDIHELAALYSIAIAQGHTFNDGNKRTAMVSMINFLWINHLAILVSDKEMENRMVAIAEKKVNRKQLTKWIKKHSYTMEELSFALKSTLEKE
jgi:death-on-curing protein